MREGPADLALKHQAIQISPVPGEELERLGGLLSLPADRQRAQPAPDFSHDAPLI
jgi:hypothetical protein